MRNTEEEGEDVCGVRWCSVVQVCGLVVLDLDCVVDFVTRTHTVIIIIIKSSSLSQPLSLFGSSFLYPSSSVIN